MTRHTTPGLHPGRTAHRALRYLAGGSADLAELLRATVGNPASARGRRFPHLLGALWRKGLISGGSLRYRLTEEGMDALVRLEGGEVVQMEAAGSVRRWAA